MPVTLRKNKYGVYEVQFYTGERVRVVSTKCTDYNEARRVVVKANFREIELLAKAGQLRTATIATLLHGDQKTNCLKLVDDWLAWAKSYGWSDASIKAASTVVLAWIKAAGIADQSPTVINEKHVDDFVNSEGEAKASTRKSRLAHIRLFVKWLAVSYRTGNPADNVRVKYKLLTHEQKETAVREPFTDDEFNRLVAALPQLNPEQQCFWTAAIWIAKTTGLRLGDVACLEWVSFKSNGMMEVWTRKRDKKVSIPIGDELLSAMLCAQGFDEKYCFPDERRTYLDVDTKATLSTQFGRLCKKAGVVGKSFHNFRHGRATEIYAESGIEEVQKQLGHASQTVSRGYIHE